MKPAASGAQAAPDLAALRSAEAYLGSAQARGFVSPQGLSNSGATDFTSGTPRLNQWSLAGNWTIAPDQIALNQPGGVITYRFRARDLHLVMGPGSNDRPVRFRVTIDGAAPGADHGADVDPMGNGSAMLTRLYQLVRQAGDVQERTFEIRFLDPHVAAYAFTFG